MNSLFRRYGIPLLVSAALHVGVSLFGNHHLLSSDTWLSSRAAARARAEQLEEKIDAVRKEKSAFINTVVDDIHDGTLDSIPFSDFFLRSELYEAALNDPVALERLPELQQTYAQQREALRLSAPADADLTSFLTTKKPEHAFGDPINDYGRMIDLLQERGYNCTARTKFHVSLEDDLRNNSFFRVKFVDNHIGLVNDPKLKDKGIIAPPEILVVGYLRSQGVSLDRLPRELAALYQRGVVGKNSFLKTTGIGEDLPPTGELVEAPIIMGVRMPESDSQELGAHQNQRARLRLHEELARGVLGFYDNGMLYPMSIPKGIDWCGVAMSFYWDYLTGSSGNGPPIEAPFEQLCYATQTPVQWKGLNLVSIFEQQKSLIRVVCRNQVMNDVLANLEAECTTWYTHYDRLPSADLDKLVEQYGTRTAEPGIFSGLNLLLFDRSDPRLKKMADQNVSLGNLDAALQIFFYSAQSVNTPFTIADFGIIYTAYATKLHNERGVIDECAVRIDQSEGSSPLVNAVGTYLLQRAARFGDDLVSDIRFRIGDSDDESLVPFLVKHFEATRTFISQHPFHPTTFADVRVALAFVRYTPLLIHHPEILGVPSYIHPHTGTHQADAHTYLSFQRYFKGAYLLFPPNETINQSFRAYLNRLSSENADSYVHDALIREGFAPVE
ncbi:MAG: hypothetical protein Q7R76_06290 [Candidatus Woesearchaeota archaeon]|nr:hypothetical protein [Candidatus Woesearchaeota archaeon]